MKPVLSPKELAQAVGVSESSVKRWVDEGSIQASRTSGGHRRIPIAEAIRFIRKTRSPIVNPEILGLTDLERLSAEPVAGEGDAERLFQFLNDGKDAEARGVLLSLYLGGETISAICDGPLQKAMERMGELWRDHEDGILREHRATDICLQALAQLRVLVDNAADEKERPLALGCAPSGDSYLLPSWAAATTLLAEGYRVLNLGPETPAKTFALAVERSRPQLTWLSVSHIPEPEKRVREWTPIAKSLAQERIHFVIGGRLRKKLPLPVSPYTLVAGTMSELTAMVRGFSAASDV